MSGLMRDLARILNQSSLNNISTYRPLSGSSYIRLPVELQSPRKRLISNKDQKCFLRCHVRHINALKELQERIRKIDKKKLAKHITNPEEITEEDKELISNLGYDGIEFPVKEKDFSETEVKNSICINVFGYEDELVFPIYVSDQKFEDSMDLLLLIDDDKSHYVYIKDFDRFMFNKAKK